MEKDIRLSKIPKPFSIESLISKQDTPAVGTEVASLPAGYPVLPFPLYNPWIAGYLSQQQPNHSNYQLLTSQKERLAQYFNSQGGVKFTEILTNYNYDRGPANLDPKVHAAKELDIESADSCNSDISLTSSPDGSRPAQGTLDLILTIASNQVSGKFAIRYANKVHFLR